MSALDRKAHERRRTALHNALADARHLRAQFEAVLAIERDND